MDGYLNWKNDTEEEQKCRHLIGRLQAARNKLTPIIDDIIVSAVDSIQRGDNKFLSECTLTVDQYQDVIWASQILREIEYQCRTDDEKYKLPNSSVIVNNVSVEHKSRMMSVRDKSIVIDEAIVVELLELYEQMGVVIQRMVAEGTQARDQPTPTSANRIISESSTSERTLRSRSSSRKHVTTTDTSLSDLDETRGDKESPPPRIKSTLSALINSSSRNLHKQPSVEFMKSDEKINKNNDDGSIFIKIQCFSDISDAEDSNRNYKDSPISCAKSCPSHYHVRLDGKPVTLKMNQNNPEEGAVYCINTGSDHNDNDIRIVIKQCPECKSTVIASSSRIKGLGDESHESITLHGKGGDETDMTYSSDGSNMCTCHDKGVICIDISRVRCDDGYTPPCSCSESEGPRSQRKLDVVIDTDNVDQSTVKVRSESSIASIHDSDSKPTSFTRAKSSVDHIHGKKSNVAIRPEPGIPLTRRRICSSMEFDVSTVHSRLRDREIEHGNAHIVVELKKLGVDKILRACRPAKCCRQAILDEKQRTALPYCVSLKSLPLMGNDAEVIKQSIDMSVKKIKNSLDLTQAYKDKLAFYVSLGRDDFKPNFNFPWVVPVFDLKLDQNSGIGPRNEEKLFILKKTVTTPRQLGYLNKLIGVSKTQQTDSQIAKNTRKTIHRKKYYILKRPKIVQPFGSRDSRSPVVRRKVSQQTNKRRPAVIQFKNQNKLNDNENNSSTRVLKCNQTRIYKRKHIWSNIGYGDWRIAFARENRDVFCRKQIDLSYVDFHFGQSKDLSNIVDLSSSKKKIVQRTNNYIKQQCIRNCLDSGDCSFASLGNMFETYLDKIQENDDIKGEHDNAIFSNIQECKEKGIVSPKSLPTFWKHISEELFYASNALTVFFKRRQSLGKVQVSQESKLEEKRCKHSSSRCLPKCEEKKSKKSVKKKMEYYVGLINGDLVWGEALPLVPRNYDMYYNYSNHNNKDQTPSSNPVEDPIVATRVTNDTSHRAYSRAAAPSESEYQNRSASPDNQSIISELITDPDKMPPESQEKNNDSPKSKFPPFSMGPESLYAPWSPFLVSEHSLPRIREEVIEKEEAPPVESEPEKEETKPKSKCSSKSVCVRNSCVKCKSRECQEKASTSKKDHPRDAIRIAIKKTKDNGICVEGKAPKACNKEICEIYKNKSMMPDKSAKHRDRDRDQTFKISGKDNIEIYINNQKICVANNKNKKSTKSNNSKYEDNQRNDKNERMEKGEKMGKNEKMEKNEKMDK